MAAWDAGYEAAAKLGQDARTWTGEDFFLWCGKNDERVPLLTEAAPSFWAWVQSVGDGAAAYYLTHLL